MEHSLQQSSHGHASFMLSSQEHNPHTSFSPARTWLQLGGSGPGPEGGSPPVGTLAMGDGVRVRNQMLKKFSWKAVSSQKCCSVVRLGPENEIYQGSESKTGKGSIASAA